VGCRLNVHPSQLQQCSHLDRLSRQRCLRLQPDAQPLESLDRHLDAGGAHLLGKREAGGELGVSDAPSHQRLPELAAG
ncbi:MAG: hypothetical protein SGPRY_012993, partial [Prymnesium sp.]